jgi:hypothetical protein
MHLRTSALAALAVPAIALAGAFPLASTTAGAASALPPTTTVSLDAKAQPTFTPRTFTLRTNGTWGCNVTLVNNTATTLALVYGTPGMWKRLPGGVVGPGASTGLGVGMANFTGYFAAMGSSNHLTIHCR